MEISRKEHFCFGWFFWCSVCGLWLCGFLVLRLCWKPLVSLVLRLVSDCTFWCFICALWLDLLVLRFGKTSGLFGAPFVVFDCTFWCFVCALWLDLLVLRFGKTSGLSGAPFVVSDCTFWCFVCALWLDLMVLRFGNTSGLFGAPFVVFDCTFWCFVRALWLDLLVLRFGKTSGLSGAPFVVSDCTFWCFVCALWLDLLVLRFGKTSGLSGAPFVVSDSVFFCKAYTATSTAEIGQLYRGQAVSQRCFSAPFLVLRLVLSGASAGAPFVASPCVFFGFLLCIVASINIKQCPIYWHEFWGVGFRILHGRLYHVTDRKYHRIRSMRPMAQITFEFKWSHNTTYAACLGCQSKGMPKQRDVTANGMSRQWDVKAK